ncbi:transposase [Coraliomargarita sp. W4R53]
MSPSDQSGVRNNCRNARIVLDKFHIMKLAGERVDQVRKAESSYGTGEAKAQLKKTLWLWRKNPDNPSESKQVHFDRIDHDYLWTSKAYQMRLALQKISNTISYQSWSSRRLQSWYN